MNRLLVIDQDRTVTQRLGLACLDRDVSIVIAQTVCEGVRVLLSDMVSLIVVDAALVRMTPRQQADLFDRVAPGVPMVAVVRSQTSLDVRVAFELAGFAVVNRAALVEDVLDKHLTLPVEELKDSR